MGVPRWEMQQSILNNLRQLSAARDQYRLENGRSPDAVAVLVGRTAYVKTMRTVGGEDYAGLSMQDGQQLTVTTPDGMSVTYDPSGANTTKIEMPPEVIRARELGARVEKLVPDAVNAYRAANNGKNPPNEKALIPYFASPKEGADFVEFIEAKKAAGL